MGSFDLRYIQESRCTSNKAPAWKTQLRNGLISPFIQSARPIGDHPSPFKQGLDFWMVFESLKLIIGTEEGVLIIQPHHKSIGNLMIFHVINEGSTVSFTV